MDPESTTQEPAGAELHGVYTPEAARPLANLILAPERTTRSCASHPQGLGGRISTPSAPRGCWAPAVQVWVLCGAREARALSAHLPDGLDVYGGAVACGIPSATPMTSTGTTIRCTSSTTRPIGSRAAPDTRSLGAADTRSRVSTRRWWESSPRRPRPARDPAGRRPRRVRPLAHLAHGNLVHAADVVAPASRCGRASFREDRIQGASGVASAVRAHPWTRLAQVYAGAGRRGGRRAHLRSRRPHRPDAGASGMLYNLKHRRGARRSPPRPLPGGRTRCS